ncbi:Leucine-rich repeat (LRR) family protein, partial [Zea mays]
PTTPPGRHPATDRAGREKQTRRDVVRRVLPAVPLLQFSRCCCRCHPPSASRSRHPNRSAGLQHGGGGGGEGEGSGSPGAGARARASGGQLRGRRALGAAPQPQGPRRRAAELGPHARQPLHLVPRHLRPRQPRHPPVSRCLPTLPRPRSPLSPAARPLQ